MTFLFTVATLTLEVKVSCWTMWNFFLFCKFFAWGSVTFTSRFLGYRHSKVSSFWAIDIQKLAVLQNEKKQNLMHGKQWLLTWMKMKLFLVLSVFKRWIFLSLKSTTKNNTANNSTFSEDEEKEANMYDLQGNIL